MTQPSIAAPAAGLSPYYEAVADYVAVHDGELDLIIGDVVTDVKDLGNGWTLGRRVDGCGNVETRPSSLSAAAPMIVVGIFPSHCVQPMIADADFDRCPGCCVSDGRATYPACWTSETNAIGSRTVDSRKRSTARFSFVEGSDDDDDDVNVYGMDLRSLGSVVHSSLPRQPASQSHVQTQQRRTASSGSSGGLRLADSGQETDDVRCGFVSATSPVVLCRDRELTTEVNKPRMIVKPNLDRNATSTSSAAGDTSRTMRDICYCSPGDCSSTGRSAVPPSQLSLGSRYRDWPTQCTRGSDYDDANSTAIANDCCPRGGRRMSAETSRKPRPPCRVVDVPLPAPTPVDRRALSADSNCKLSLYGDDAPASEGRCSEAAGLYRDAGSSFPARSVYESGYYSRSLADSRSCRLVISVVVGHLIGAAVFLWMFFHLGYGPMTAVAVSSTVAVLTCVMLALSRVCRCTAALAVPSLCTANGRVAFVIVAAGFLLAGPVSNVYVNMEEISRAMGCSAEQAYNQTMFLLQPFDAMMVQLNWTIGGLQHAARNISRGLKPLEDGLDLVEMDLYNGRLQLYGTRKTCKNLVDTAFNACSTGIRKAQDQCLSVMGALGTVYHHARDVLDRINPDRWSSKQQHHPQPHMKKRQVLLKDGRMIDDLDLTATDRDICEPLDMVTVCHNLNDSDTLCQPSRWAGEAIQDAINATQAAMTNLRAALQFYVSSEPYYNARVNASRLVFQIRRRVHDEFASHAQHFHRIVDALKKLAPLGLLVLLHAAYIHLRRYLASDRYDNVYVTDGFRAIDARRAAMVAGGSGILPLKPYERASLIDISQRRLSPSERHSNGSGLAVVCLFALLAVACVAFDGVLYWLLALVERHGRPGFDATGSDSLELVVAGDGVIVELLDVFLQGFHPGRWFSFSGDRRHTCLPQPRPPSAANLVALVVLQLVLLLVVVFRARLRRWRCRVAGYFYRDREKARLAHLYAVIVARRSRLPRLLHSVVRYRYSETQLGVHGGLVHRLLSWFVSLSCAGRRCCCCCCRPNRACCCLTAECLVCGARSGRGGVAFQICAGGVCRAAYCSQCFDDLDRICPLCLQGGGFYDGLNDEEDYCNSFDDELKSYCKTGNTGV